MLVIRVAQKVVTSLLDHIWVIGMGYVVAIAMLLSGIEIGSLAEIFLIPILIWLVASVPKAVSNGISLHLSQQKLSQLLLQSITTKDQVQVAAEKVFQLLNPRPEAVIKLKVEIKFNQKTGASDTTSQIDSEEEWEARRKAFVNAKLAEWQANQLRKKS